MIFIFNKKQIVVDCFTQHQFIFDLSKFRLAAHYLPEWWRQLPKVNNINYVDRPTMKSCQGFLDLYRYGFIAPMWADFSVHFEPDGSYRWEYADQISFAQSHPQWQRGAFRTDLANIKLVSPWKLKEKTGIKFFNTGCFWNFPDADTFQIATGVSDFKYQNNTDINLLLPTVNKSRTFLIKYGTPLVQFVPLTEKKILLKHHLVGEAEFKKISQEHGPISFINRYKISKKVKG